MERNVEILNLMAFLSEAFDRSFAVYKATDHDTRYYEYCNDILRAEGILSHFIIDKAETGI